MPVVEVTDGVVVVLDPEPEEDVDDEFEVDAVVDDEEEVIDDEAVVTAAVVIASVEPPLYDRAATEPNTPTAATLAIVVPTVRIRSRATARSRSLGLRRVAALIMGRGCRANLSLS